jgi:hypothetical protein
MNPLAALALLVLFAAGLVALAVLARSVLAQHRARYITRLQAEWQTVLALFEQDPSDADYMRPVAGRIKCEDMRTLLEHLARAPFEIEYVKGLRRELPREVASVLSSS